MSANDEVIGTVESWDNQQGWGVLLSPDVRGTVSVHFSDLASQVYRSLRIGQRVKFRFEQPGRRGCDYRTTWVDPFDDEGNPMSTVPM